jgi:hypothetical protein
MEILELELLYLYLYSFHTFHIISHFTTIHPLSVAAHQSSKTWRSTSTMNFVVVAVAIAIVSVSVSSVSASPYFSEWEEVDIDFATLKAPASPTDVFNFTANGNMNNPYQVRVTDVTLDNRTLLQFDSAVGVSAANAANRTGTVLQIEVIDGFKQIYEGFSPGKELKVVEVVVAPGFGRDVQVRFNPNGATFNVTSTRSEFDMNVDTDNVTLTAPMGEPVVLQRMKVLKEVRFLTPRYKHSSYIDEGEYIGIIVGSVIGAILFVAIVVGVAIFIVRRRRAVIS